MLGLKALQNAVVLGSGASVPRANGYILQQVQHIDIMRTVSDMATMLPCSF